MAIGLVFFALALVLLAIYYFQYSSAYKDLFKTDPIVSSSPAPSPIEVEQNFNLTIAKIAVEAPLILNVDGNDELAYLTALEKGVAHLSGSVFPGQLGNSFIFGHSSYYFYAPGLYKSIFANLDELDIGDDIIVNSEKNEYHYKIFEIRIVDPDDVEITKNVPDHPETLTLMTCTPTGTTLKRLIIFADIVQ